MPINAKTEYICDPKATTNAHNDYKMVFVPKNAKTKCHKRLKNKINERY
jgi:hypothetical protein